VDEFRLLPKFFGTDFSRVWLGINYGDATLLPPLRLDDYAHLASDPTPARMRRYVLGGERMAWCVQARRRADARAPDTPGRSWAGSRTACASS